MIFSNSIQFTFIAIIVIIIQLFIPVINIGGLVLIPDILIIFLTYIGFYYGRLEAIIIGFLFGIVQDFTTQLELIGVMSFIKSLIGYCLGTLAIYRNIWHNNFRLIVIFFIYLLHFIILQSIRMNGIMINNFLFIKITLIQTILCFIILIVFDKSIMKIGILQK